MRTHRSIVALLLPALGLVLLTSCGDGTPEDGPAEQAKAPATPTPMPEPQGGGEELAGLWQHDELADVLLRIEAGGAGGRTLELLMRIGEGGAQVHVVRKWPAAWRDGALHMGSDGRGTASRDDAGDALTLAESAGGRASYRRCSESLSGATFVTNSAEWLASTAPLVAGRLRGGRLDMGSLRLAERDAQGEATTVHVFREVRPDPGTGHIIGGEGGRRTVQEYRLRHQRTGNVVEARGVEVRPVGLGVWLITANGCRQVRDQLAKALGVSLSFLDASSETGKKRQ